MDLESGRPVFIEELVTSSTDMVGQTVRVTGTLNSYSPSSDQALLYDGQYMIIIDTQLLGVQQYNPGHTYQFIGTVSEPSSDINLDTTDLTDDIHFSHEIIMQPRVVREVDGLDMDIYRKSVFALRKFLADTNDKELSTISR